ncbi:MAG TPA: SUMF1/EgtB/PvdO family nonheme iron enzyme, partial [Spirochaetia bacterium]
IHLEHFWFLYEKDYHDAAAGAFRARKYVEDVREDFGPFEATCLWQSYPRLGLDQRNQYDYYRDLPGGLAEVRRIVEVLHAAGVKAFLNYNPWDTGTRREGVGDGEAVAAMLKETGADGVFLDTVEATDPGLLSALKSVRADIAVCPELIPPLSDLRTVSGAWQQFAPPCPPEVLLHRWLDPGFCLRFIDRYARSHREQIAWSFLHGNGHVAWENVFGWWNPWSDEDRLFLKRTLALQRACEEFFVDPEWQPFVGTGVPGVFAMEWHHDGAVLFTIYNSTSRDVPDVTIALPEAARGAALVDLWSGKEPRRTPSGRDFVLTLGRGDIACVVAGPPPSLPALPEAPGDGRRHRPVTLAAYEARPVPMLPLRPRRVSALPARSRRGASPMAFIPGGRYVMRVRRACDPVMEGGTYADISHPTAKAVPDQHFWLDAYAMGRTPVTRAEYRRFLRVSGYCPARLDRFLDDWRKPRGAQSDPSRWDPPEGTGDHPVVWVSLDDARAYASWAGLRLPTEAEWQRAAEGPHGTAWPWGDTPDPARCNGDSPATQSVFSHPDGASAEGCLDMCGNAWEWTESERDDGHMRYAMVRGGCHLRVTGSVWYTASGAQPCAVHEKVPLLGAGIDRLATVGFRCVGHPAMHGGTGCAPLGRPAGHASTDCAPLGRP